MRFSDIRNAFFVNLAILCLISSITLADDASEERLSWAPFDFLRQGYRNAPWVKDPFYPQGDVLRLMGIISNDMAYISGQWVHPGEQINGYLVKKISPRGVVLTRNSEIRLLKLDDEDAK